MPDWEEHHHCRVCGNVCGADTKVCSPACQAKRDEQLRQKRNLQMVMYAAIAVLILVLAINLSHG